METQVRFAQDPPAMQPTVPEMVLLYLRQLLVTGELPPGSKVPVDRVAEACGVSPVPVREALKHLQAEGVVVNEPRRGYFVPRHSQDEFAELQHITSLLEREAMRLGVPRLTDTDVDRMDGYRVEMEEALAEGDMWTTNVAHREMHFVPYHAAGLPRLIREIQRLWEHTDHYRVVYVYKNSGVQAVSLSQHLDLIEACRSRDPERAIYTMGVHREFANSTITPGLLDNTDPDANPAPELSNPLFN